MGKPKEPKPDPPADETDEEAAAAAANDALPSDGPLLTLDDRECVGICTTNPLPGMAGAPDPPKEAALG